MNVLQLGQDSKLSWEEYGKSRGYPVFYFHGLPGSRLEPESAEAAAKALGIRIIAIDRFGYGDSLPASGHAFSKFCDALSEVAAALDLCNYSLLGFSGGAPYALACASRLANQIDKITIVSAVADFSTPVMQKHANPDTKPLFELAAADPKLARTQFETLAPSTDALMQMMQSNIPPDDQRIFSIAKFYDHYFNNLATALNQGVDGMLNDASLLGSPWPFDIRDIRVPTTIWHGDEDRNCHIAIPDYFANNIPAAQLNVLPGKGHFFIFEYWLEILSELVNGYADGIA